MLKKLGRRIFAIIVFALVGAGFYTIYTVYMRTPIMDEFREAQAYYDAGEFDEASRRVEGILDRKPYQRETLHLKQKLFVEKTVAETFAKGDNLIGEAEVCVREGNYTCASDLYSKAYQAYTRLPYGATDDHKNASEQHVQNLLTEFNRIEHDLSVELVGKARAKASRDRMEAYYFLAGSKVESREVTLYKSTLAYDVAHTRIAQLNQRVNNGQTDNGFLVKEISLWLERVDESSPQFDDAQKTLKELQP